MPSPYSFDYNIGGQIFTWDLDTAMDRLLGRDGENLGNAVDAAGDIAGAAAGNVAANIAAQIEPWVSRVAIILLALVFIAGGIALLSSGGPARIREALA